VGDLRRCGYDGTAPVRCTLARARRLDAGASASAGVAAAVARAWSVRWQWWHGCGRERLGCGSSEVCGLGDGAAAQTRRDGETVKTAADEGRD
jgi:hypothetical protein